MTWLAGLTWTSEPTLLVIYALALYRLTRLVTEDYVTERPRTWLAERGLTWSVFITCPWCVSVWLAGGWLILAAVAAPVALVLGAILALSAVAGLLSSWE